MQIVYTCFYLKNFQAAANAAKHFDCEIYIKSEKIEYDSYGPFLMVKVSGGNENVNNFFDIFDIIR